VRHPIVIPNLGLVESVTLVEWSKTSGDQVAKGDVVAVVETEKALVEIEAPADGVLTAETEAGPELIAADAAIGYIET
jgi:pyruvate/2-oxoglutarate dehydrogenase complex dihydrolipoamide acyltransferase (E2) component